MRDDGTYVYVYKLAWNKAIEKTNKFVDELDTESMDPETVKKCVQAYLCGLKIQKDD